jgi:SAM-dependent methyltransferase
MLWARVMLTAPSMLGNRFKSQPYSRASPALKQSVEQAKPDRPSYERLASVYHEYSQSFCPDYPAFLQALGRRHGVTFRSVLDVACGAATVTSRLAPWVPRVVGIDLSAAMLESARAVCREQPGVQFVQADYRQFDLNERFDAAVCASDSLNYLKEPRELQLVLACVARHLHPGGLFVFDALDDRGMRRYSDRFVAIRLGDRECTIVLRYDPARRVEESLVIFGSDVELHRRVPIEPADVLDAARAANLAVLDWFSIAGFGLLKYGGIRNFYVLRQSS